MTTPLDYVPNLSDVKPVDILLVEDSPSDVAMTVAALGDGRILNTVHVVSDGSDAMDFMHRRGEYANVPTPDLVLLDLNLPRIDGLEVLRLMRSDPRLTIVPVIVLTTSSAERDILRAYEHHANAYITKPVSYQAFLDAMKTVDDFWLSLVRLPHVNGRVAESAPPVL